jgi:hypothetical protein
MPPTCLLTMIERRPHVAPTRVDHRVAGRRPTSTCQPILGRDRPHPPAVATDLPRLGMQRPPPAHGPLLHPARLSSTPAKSAPSSHQWCTPPSAGPFTIDPCVATWSPPRPTPTPPRSGPPRHYRCRLHGGISTLVCPSGRLPHQPTCRPPGRRPHWPVRHPPGCHRCKHCHRRLPTADSGKADIDPLSSILLQIFSICFKCLV